MRNILAAFFALLAISALVKVTAEETGVFISEDIKDSKIETSPEELKGGTKADFAERLLRLQSNTSRADLSDRQPDPIDTLRTENLLLRNKIEILERQVQLLRLRLERAEGSANE